MAARDETKRNKNTLPTFCHDGCQRSTGKLFFCETPNTALCATPKSIIYVYLLSGVCTLHCKDSPLSCFAVHIEYPCVDEESIAHTSWIKSKQELKAAVCKFFFVRTWVKD